jgi:hypothetical protein
MSSSHFLSLGHAAPLLAAVAIARRHMHVSTEQWICFLPQDPPPPFLPCLLSPLAIDSELELAPLLLGFIPHHEIPSATVHQPPPPHGLHFRAPSPSHEIKMFFPKAWLSDQPSLYYEIPSSRWARARFPTAMAHPPWLRSTLTTSSTYSGHPHLLSCRS